MLNEADIAALYEKHGHALFKRSLRLLGNRDDAHEIVQETFCQFYAGRDRFKGESSPFTFLYRVTTNLSIDRLRRRVTANKGGETLREGGEPMGPNAEPHAAAVQELAMLTEGMDDETLTIAVMSHVDGMTQEEIAEALSLSRKTIGKKLGRFTEVAQSRAGVSRGRAK
jgi:RNA polymerase sigma-70 factor, ECF subfamily